MIKNFFNKFGITLTKEQVRLIKVGIGLFIFMLLNELFIFTVLTHAPIGNTQCVSTTDYYVVIGTQHLSCKGSLTAGGPIWLLIIEGILLLGGLIVFAVNYFGYIVRLIFNKEFRAKEMAGSVQYMETDEREQLLTMKATKQSYMILNFLLLVGWLISLVMGNMPMAFTLFIIQVVGALSFRKNMKTAA